MNAFHGLPGIARLGRGEMMATMYEVFQNLSEHGELLHALRQELLEASDFNTWEAVSNLDGQDHVAQTDCFLPPLKAL